MNEGNNELTEKEKKNYRVLRIIIQAILLVVIVGGLIALTVFLYPYFIKINTNEEYRTVVIDKINSYGHFSWAIILLAQIIQTILAVIPSGPIVILSGMLYNPFVSILLCLVGQTIGCLIVYFLVKLLGYRFIALFYDPEKIKNSKLLKSESKTEVLMFGYLLIPALPKDIVAFIAPFTKVKWYSFLLINFVARILMTTVSVLMGSSLLNGNFYIAIILACISFILSLLCFIFNKKIVDFLDKFKNKKNIKTE